MAPGEPGIDSDTQILSGQLGGAGGEKETLLRPQSPAADREMAYSAQDTI